jgi:hypothetical protein
MIKKIKLTIIFKVINKNKDFSNSEYFGTVFLKNEMIDIFIKVLIFDDLHNVSEN